MHEIISHRNILFIKLLYNNNNTEKLILRLKMLAQTQGRTILNNRELGTELMSFQHNLKSQQRD